MLRDRLWRSWIWLLVWSLASTAIAVAITQDLAGASAGAAILLLAYLKARLILARYLGLAEAPSWFSGFKLAIGGYMLLLLLLYLIPEL